MMPRKLGATHASRVCLALAACGPRPEVTPAVPGAQADATVPMREEPYHRLVLENPRVAVYDVVLPLAAVMKYHEHPTNHLAVVIDSGRMANEILGRPPIMNPTGPSGTIVYLAAGPPHRQTNIGEAVVRFIAVEVLGEPKKATPGGEDTDQRAAPDGKPGCRVAIDASDVRAWRCRLATGESAPARDGAGPFLRVALSGGNLQTGPGGTSQQITPGIAEWHDDPRSGEATNSGAGPLEFVDLEWK